MAEGACQADIWSGHCFGRRLNSEIFNLHTGPVTVTVVIQEGAMQYDATSIPQKRPKYPIDRLTSDHL